MVTEQEFVRISGGYKLDVLPDGSAVVTELGSKTVHGLRPIAAAAFAACERKAALKLVSEKMSAQLSTTISKEAALEALCELENAGLVMRQEPKGQAISRRSAFRVASSSIGPLVLTMTAAEQILYAQAAGSGNPGAGGNLAISPNSVCFENGVLATPGFVITGTGTHFTNASVVTFSNTGVTASNVSASSPTSLTLTLITNINNVDAANPSDVTVVTGAETVTGTGILQVNSCL